MARPEVTGRRMITRAALSIDEFCRSFGFSRAQYYVLKERGEGPDEMRVGRRVFITVDAQKRWEKRFTVKAARQDDTATALELLA